MDTDTVRRHAEAHAQAVVAGDFRRASEDLSDAAKSVAQDVMRQLPAPVESAKVESASAAGEQFIVNIRYVGPSGDATIESQWRDEEGRPKITGLKVV